MRGLLYAGLDSILSKASKLESLVGGFPVVTDVQIQMVYLGEVQDLAEVEVKKSKEAKGWLYNQSAIVFFHHEGSLYEVFIKDLRELAEEKLAAKKLIKPEETLEAGVMKRGEGGRISGYVDVKDIVAISRKVEGKYEH